MYPFAEDQRTGVLSGMPHGHQTIYVLVSIVVAILGAWTALDLQRRVRAHSGRQRLWWLASASMAMGLSIWSMHFIAMLGFDAGVPVRYDAGLTIASLVLAIAATLVAFLAVQIREPTQRQVALAGLTMGIGICLMHYVGMAAVRAPATLRYDPWLVAASLLIAVLASWGALVAALRDRALTLRVVGAVVLGFAITSMHYTAMAAASFTPTRDAILGSDDLDRLSMALGIGASTLLLLFLALIAAMFDRRFIALAVREAHAIAEREAYMRDVLGKLPLGVIVAAPSGAIEFVNPAVERLLRPENKLVAFWDGANDRGAFHPDGRPFAADEYPLARTLLKGEMIDGEVLLYRRHDGTELYLEVSSTPIVDQDGQVVQAVLTMQDVSRRVEAEQTLQQSQRLEVVGQLTGGVAHDFNNLLTAIIGGLELALPRVTDAKVKRWIDAALQAGRRGAKLTTQLLAFSRRQRLETKAVDINALVGGMAELLASTLGGTVRIDLDLHPEAGAATADPTQLELAIVNLAINARDAMSGSGTLTIRTGRSAIQRTTAAHEPPPGDYVTVTVADTGSGMTRDILSRIFDPFFTTKPVGKGSGLGLSQVLGLAKQLGGGVRVQTELGVGSQIAIYLPPAEPVAMAEPVPKPRAVVARSDASILLVDDDDAVRSYVSDLLHEAGYAVTAVASGAAALAEIEKGTCPDAALLDFAMPEMNGAEVAAALGQRCPRLPVMMMTGYADRDALPISVGQIPMLSKPFAPDVLLARLSGLVQQASSAK